MKSEPVHTKNFLNERGFTLVEILIVISIIAVLTVTLYLVLNLSDLLERSRTSRAEATLISLAKAAKLESIDTGGYAADVARGVAASFADRLNPPVWPVGSFEGSSYDWDNWDGDTCWDGSQNIIQITLRDIASFQGNSNYTMYFVLQGQGIPHCNDPLIRGVCINCDSLYP